jgi:Zn-finger nucleic acid-binding protein
MEAQTLNCPNCGAAVASDAPLCRYCESKLATVVCPSCFGMMFIGSQHCPHCGASPTEAAAAPLSVLKCPRCKVDMSSVVVGGAPVRECESCAGLWVEAAAFEKICTDREQQSALLGTAAPLPPPHAAAPPVSVSYAPCPQCSQLMNRINFARCSGVIVDVCKGHGTWFDPDELREILEFIRAGGFEIERRNQKLEIEHERQKLREEQYQVTHQSSTVRLLTDDERVSGLSAARGLLKFLID